MPANLLRKNSVSEEVKSTVSSLKIYEVEAKSEAFATHIKNRIGDLRKSNKLSRVISVEEFAPANTPLTVMGVPKIFPDSELQKLISEKLKTKIVRVAADTDQRHQWYTGKRMYYVDTTVLKAANVPESINWNNGEWRFYLSYPGQVKVCRKCGEADHYARDCTAVLSDIEQPVDNEETKSGKSSTSSDEDSQFSGNEENEKSDMVAAFERPSDVINIHKRKNSSSPNKTEDPKKPANKPIKRVVSLPSLKIAPRSNIRKICPKCNDCEYVVQPSDGFYISYCEKCDPICLNAATKCFEKACVLKKTWNKLPSDRERIQCANAECATTKYVCKCNIFHSVESVNTSYECDQCHACIDPSL